MGNNENFVEAKGRRRLECRLINLIWKKSFPIFFYQSGFGLIDRLFIKLRLWLGTQRSSMSYQDPLPSLNASKYSPFETEQTTTGKMKFSINIQPFGLSDKGQKHITPTTGG